MSKWHATKFAEHLGKDFYADDDYIRASLDFGRPFNVIHIPSAFKIDVFPATEEFHYAQLERASLSTFDFFDQRITCRVVAAEDVLLAKLRWFKISGRSSERQWNDVAGVISVVANGLDRQYLEVWAAKLGVSDLLEQALNQPDKHPDS